MLSTPNGQMKYGDLPFSIRIKTNTSLVLMMPPLESIP